MYDPSGRLLLIPPRTERRERRIFGTHIHLAYYNACIACTCVDIILILLALLGYFYPNPFRRSPLYNQIFQKIDRFLVQFWYSIALLLLALFLLFHIASLGFSLFSIQYYCCFSPPRLAGLGSSCRSWCFVCCWCCCCSALFPFVPQSALSAMIRCGFVACLPYSSLLPTVFSSRCPSSR